MHKDRNIDKRISEYLLGRLSEQEARSLNEEVGPEFMKELLEEDNLVERYEAYAKADTEKALYRALERIYPSSRSYRWKIAAVLLCIIATGALFWYHDYTRVTPPMLEQDTENFMIKALEAQRVVSGDDIDSSEDGTAFSKPVYTDYISSFPLTADVAEKMLNAENIMTYHDKEHWLTLDDGTIVHLDVNTRIIYPEHFSHFGTREVVLDGDAYFMVAHDKSRRFIVHTKYGDVTDYGTEFFVSGKQGLEVALISGSAGVMPSGKQETILTPGQKVSVTHSGEVTKTTIDLEEYKAWNTGKFAFAGKDLQTVMAIISRWYGVAVYYDKEEYRNILITGNYDRCPEVLPLLESLEYVTKLHFDLKEDVVEIK